MYTYALLFHILTLNNYLISPYWVKYEKDILWHVFSCLLLLIFGPRYLYSEITLCLVYLPGSEDDAVLSLISGVSRAMEEPVAPSTKMEIGMVHFPVIMQNCVL